MSEGMELSPRAVQKVCDHEQKSHFIQPPTSIPAGRPFGKANFAWYVVCNSEGEFESISDPDSAALKPCGQTHVRPVHFQNLSDGINGCYKATSPILEAFDVFGLALVTPGNPVLLKRNRWNGRLETCVETNLQISARYKEPGAVDPHKFEVVIDGQDTAVFIELDFGSTPTVDQIYELRFERSVGPTYWDDCSGHICGKWIASGGGDSCCETCPNGLPKNSIHVGMISGTDAIVKGETYEVVIDGQTYGFIASHDFAAGIARTVVVFNSDACELIAGSCCIDEPVVVPCPSCSPECVQMFKNLELVYPRRFTDANNVTYDKADEYVLTFDGSKWIHLEGLFEGEAIPSGPDAGKIRVTEIATSDLVAYTGAGQSGSSAKVCEEGVCNPPFAVTLNADTPITSEGAFHTVLSVGDRLNPVSGFPRYFKMTATDGTTTYESTNSLSIEPGPIVNTWLCVLRFRLLDETGAALSGVGATIFPAIFPPLTQEGNSSLIFNSDTPGKISISHNESFSPTFPSFSGVPAASNPQWPGINALHTTPWTGVSEIWQSGADTGHRVTVTIEAI